MPQPSATAETAVLVQELLDYEIRITASGGAFQAGAFGTRHDDLATALGLAVLHTEGPMRCVAGPYAVAAAGSGSV